MEYQDCPAEPFYPELPPENDISVIAEVESQRAKWTAFIASRGDSFNEEWLWQYWRAEFRPKSQIFKKAMSMFSSRLSAQKKIKRLMRKGIPPELRGRIWYACSGASQMRKSASASEQYSALLTRIHELDDSIIAFDIEKDLRRTFPEDPRVNNERGLAALHRVLSAYAIRRPDIGYCQSMNYVAAMLLFHQSEEKAFWTLSALIENILPPDYYSHSMIGGRVDQQVFQSCIAWKLPQIHEVLKSTRTGLEPVTTPWFLCLFINTLPLYTVCRVWDCLFWEGSIVLFRVALACMKLKSKEISECSDIISVYVLLKTNNHRNTYDLSDRTTSEDSARSSLTLESATSSAASASPNPRLSGKYRSPATQLLYFAFGKQWLVSMPRQPIDNLRIKIRTMLTEQDNEAQARRNKFNATAAALSNGAGKPRNALMSSPSRRDRSTLQPPKPTSAGEASEHAGDGHDPEARTEGEEDHESGGSAAAHPHMSMRAHMGIQQELLLRALDETGVGNLVELAGHMDAGIGHDTLAQEQFGSLASHDEDDDADHDDEEDDF